MTQKKDISIIIPVFNEEESIPPLIEKLLNTIKELSLQNYEIIFVDDGSTDLTFKYIENWHEKYNFIRAVKLRKNFGKSVAYLVGFNYAKYDIIITMDGDLQDDPQDIRLFLEKINGGYDLVTGWKAEGKGTRRKSIESSIFNWVIRKAFDISLHDLNCPFKAYKKVVVEGIKLYSGTYRFIPVFAQAQGFKIAEIKIHNLPRIHGKSKYGGRRILGGFFDLLTSVFIIKFNQNPMHFFGTLALFCGTLGTIMLSYLTILSLGGEKVGSRPIFSLGILLEIMSMQFFSIGFLGEMFTRNAINTNTSHFIDKKI